VIVNINKTIKVLNFPTTFLEISIPRTIAIIPIIVEIKTIKQNKTDQDDNIIKKVANFLRSIQKRCGVD